MQREQRRHAPPVLGVDLGEIAREFSITEAEAYAALEELAAAGLAEATNAVRRRFRLTTAGLWAQAA